MLDLWLKVDDSPRTVADHFKLLEDGEAKLAEMQKALASAETALLRVRKSRLFQIARFMSQGQ
jgi:hypothetical protein